MAVSGVLDAALREQLLGRFEECPRIGLEFALERDLYEDDHDIVRTTTR